MRVAFIGKGGAGKSALVGTFARLLAQHDEPVLVIDSDPMPGLALSLGMQATDAGIPDDATVERADGEDGPRLRLRPGLSAAEAIDRYSAWVQMVFGCCSSARSGSTSGHPRALPARVPPDP